MIANQITKFINSNSLIKKKTKLLFKENLAHLIYNLTSIIN